MSEIPNSVGGAVFGNIAAYGVQISDVLEWLTYTTEKVMLINVSPQKASPFLSSRWLFQDQPDDVILRAPFASAKHRSTALALRLSHCYWRRTASRSTRSANAEGVLKPASVPEIDIPL